MKKILILAAALSLLAACNTQKGPKEYRVSENTELNLGKIKEIDGPVTFKMLARNDQADTLYPVRIYAPCGCTAADTRRKPVAPGEDEVIEVTYNPAYRPGKMMEEIQVYYRDSPVKMRSFIICGEVKGYLHPIEESCRYALGEGFYSSHKVLSYGLLNPGETKDMFFRYGNGGKKKAKVAFDVPEEWQPYLRLRQPCKMKANERDTVHVKFTLPEGADSASFFIRPRVNGKAVEEPIKVVARRRPAAQ